MDKLELSTNLGAVVVESNKILEEVAVVRGARDHVQRLVRSIVVQFVEALDASVNQVENHVVDCFCTGLENAYDGSKLAFPYTLAHVSGVGTASLEVQ